MNVEEIESVHRELQSSLKAAQDDPSAAISVFKAFAERLKVYAVYISGFELAAAELHRWEREGLCLHFVSSLFAF